MLEINAQNGPTQITHFLDIKNNVEQDLINILTAIKNNTYEQSMKEYNTLLLNCEKLMKANAEIDWYEMYLTLGNIYNRLQWIEKEEEVCRVILAQNPTCTDTCWNLCALLEEIGRKAESLEYYQKFLSLIQEGHKPTFESQIEAAQIGIEVVDVMNEVISRVETEMSLKVSEHSVNTQNNKKSKKKKTKNKPKTHSSENNQNAELASPLEPEALTETLKQTLQKIRHQNNNAAEDIKKCLQLFFSKKEILEEQHDLHELYLILVNKYLVLAQSDSTQKVKSFTQANTYLKKATEQILTHEKEHAVKLLDIIIILQQHFSNTEISFIQQLSKEAIKIIKEYGIKQTEQNLNKLNMLSKIFQDNKQDNMDIANLFEIILQHENFVTYYSPERQLHMHWSYAYYCTLLGKIEEAQIQYDIISASSTVSAHKLLVPSAFEPKPQNSSVYESEAMPVVAEQHVFEQATTPEKPIQKKSKSKKKSKKQTPNIKKNDFQKESDIPQVMREICQKIMSNEEIIDIPCCFINNKIRYKYVQQLDSLINELSTRNNVAEYASIITKLAETGIEHLNIDIKDLNLNEEKYEFSYLKASCYYALFIYDDLGDEDYYCDEAAVLFRLCLDLFDNLPIAKKTQERQADIIERISYVLGKLYFHHDKHSLSLQYYSQALSFKEFQTEEVYSSCILMAQSLKKNAQPFIEPLKTLNPSAISSNIFPLSKKAHENFKKGNSYGDNHELYHKILNILYRYESCMPDFTHLLAFERIIFQGIATGNYDEAMKLAFLSVDLILSGLDEKEQHIPILCQYVRLLLRDNMVALSKDEKAYKLSYAEKILLKAILIAPNSLEAQFELAWLYQMQGMNDKALEQYQVVCSLESTEEFQKYTRLALGHKASINGRYDVAIRHYERYKENLAQLDLDALFCANYYACLGDAYDNAKASQDSIKRDEAYAQARVCNPYYQMVMNSPVAAPVFIKSISSGASLGIIYCSFQAENSLSESQSMNADTETSTMSNVKCFT